jgi:LacI family transcriptional regulator
MTTLKDVARLAGVSPKTVSRVVNNDPMVSAETRSTVERFVAELGYVPNDAARRMRTQTSRVVGFLTDVIATTPYSVDIVRGVQDELRRDGRTLLIANSGGSKDQEAEYWRLFRAQGTAGAFYATMFHREVDLSGIPFASPVVLVNCYDRKGRYPCVLPDDLAGGYEQARHLLELGHRRIGLVSLNPILRAAELRRQGIEAAHHDAGVSFDAALVRPGMDGPIGRERLFAYEATLELMSRKKRPTAIICGHDQIALQVMSAAASLGLRVPDDLSVIGFDDQHTITEALRPALTTVALPYLEMGYKASAILDELLSDSTTPNRTVQIRCPLVVRDSCRPPKSTPKLDAN